MEKPHDHYARMDRARASLDGLSMGDAFGERFFVSPSMVHGLIEARVLPPAPWFWTDDTEMALAICEVLDACGAIDRDRLAGAFARRWAAAPDRGYGGGAFTLLRELALGGRWQDRSPALFDGGSFGNGGAMRAAPVGAYFADDLGAVIGNARASAEVTHAHPEGKAGAIATALAAAFALRARAAAGVEGELLQFVLAHTPEGETRDGIAAASALAPDTSPSAAAAALGSGSRVSSMDTVPFALFCASRHLHDFEEAMWATVAGLGDRDTTCAIVGGIVVLATGVEAIPAHWRAAREPIEEEPLMRRG